MKKNVGGAAILSSRVWTAWSVPAASARLVAGSRARASRAGSRKTHELRRVKYHPGAPQGVSGRISSATKAVRVAIDRTARSCRGVLAVACIVATAPLAADAPAVQPHRRDRDARSSRLDLSARRAGDLPHRRGPRWPPGGGSDGEVWRGAGDAAADDRVHRHRRRDATDRGRRHDEGAWLPAPRGDRRRSTAAPIAASAPPASPRIGSSRRRSIRRTSTRSGRASARVSRRCRSMRGGHRCPSTAMRTSIARRSTCRTSGSPRDEPAVWHPVRAARGGKVSSAPQRARRRRAAVPRPAGDRRRGPHHLPDRHPRHPGDPAAGGVRQPGPGRVERVSDVRARLARALLLPPRLHGTLRANDFLASLPQWDGLQPRGDRRQPGGALAIVTAGLDRRVTRLASSIRRSRTSPAT